MAAHYPFTAGPHSNQGSTPVAYPAVGSNNPYRALQPSPTSSTMPSGLPPRPAQQANRPYAGGAVDDAPRSTTNLLTPGGKQSNVQAAFARGPPSLRSQASSSTLNETKYPSSKSGSFIPSISDKFSLSPDPTSWGANLSMNYVEPDDYLHNPDPKRDRKFDQGGSVLTSRGFANLGCLIVLATGLIALFAGFPLISFFTRHKLTTNGGFNLGGINASGQLASMPGNWALIDKDTPQEFYTKPGYTDSSVQMELVFSDEFNVDGRTFYPGDDPYWEAVDLHYWQTNNLEWYDPEAITTKDGALQITLSRKNTHGLNYEGGMMSTWNKFCFTGGLIEANVSLPGYNNIEGFWPAVWTMGNLGRAGYGASLEGMWPYTYDTCDVGTVANQTKNGLPLTATAGGDPSAGGALSFLPGQRLSRCTCAGESHPGPMHSDGTFVGRSAPEIDIFEAQITGDPLSGQVSQSAQWGPFNQGYQWFNTSQTLDIYDTTQTFLNPYMGGAFQQATSGVTQTDQECYENEGGCFSVYGYEYVPGFDNAYITWISSGKAAWTLQVAGMGQDTRVEIGPRPVPQEPMYIIANLGMSTNFGTVDLENLPFPARLRIDYIRVYQPAGQKNVGCDPPDFPTAAYINQYLEAYTNPNLTTWQDDFKQPFPKNSFLGQC